MGEWRGEDFEERSTPLWARSRVSSWGLKSPRERIKVPMRSTRERFLASNWAEAVTKVTATFGVAGLLVVSFFSVAHAGQQSGGEQRSEGQQSSDGETVPPLRVATNTRQDSSSLKMKDSDDIGDTLDAGVSLLNFEGDTPYLTWEVTPAEAGSVFSLQGPATRSGSTGTNWGTTYSIDDCVAELCSGPDLDPAPGQFLVQQVGNHRIDSANRYRLTPTTAPSGKFFSSTGTKEIPGSRATPSTNTWNNGVYDFGSFETLSNTPSCEAGFVYSITSGGQLKQINPSGNVTNIGASASVANMNGLGIGTSGASVFAYNRTSTGGNNPSYGIEVYEFNTATGTWARAGVGRPGGSGSGKDQISTPYSVPVGGAVCSCTGAFFMGGFNLSGTEFYLYMYDPASNSITSKGKISTPNPGSGVHNGDLVFDSVGNLYILRSSANSNNSTTSTLTVFSVLAENLKDATASTTLQATALDDVSISMGAANGVAFDSAGKAYLQVTPNSTSGSISSFDLPKFNNRQNILTSSGNLAGVTDLASCSAPPAVRLQKEVMGERFSNSDQFKLTLHDESQELVAVTTDGPSSGLQTKVAGPVLTQRGEPITLAETFTGSDSYATTYKCVATNTTPLAVDTDPVTILEGTGTYGTFNVPTASENGGTKGQIICTLSNSPLKGSVTWTKNNGQGSLLPGSEWRISGPGFTAPGGLVQDCVAANEDGCTGLDKDPVAGQFKLDPLAYGDYTLVEVKAPEGYVKNPTTHNFTISEEQKDVLLPGADTVNQLQPTITLLKETCGVPDPDDPSKDVPCVEHWTAAESWELKASGSGAQNQLSGADGWSSTGEDGSAGTWTLDMSDTAPVDVTIQELGKPPLWHLQEIVCEAEGEEPQAFDNDGTNPGIGSDLSVQLTDVKPGSAWTCTFRNRFVRPAAAGNVSWSKVGEDGGRLTGSEWEITGPLGKESETTWKVTDCTDGTQCPNLGGAFPADGDRDPAVGGFKVEGLVCGNYTLTETKAPIGYQKLKDPIQFIINGTCNTQGEINPNTVIGDVKNVLGGPSLPLTGGASAFTYLAFGGGLLGLAGAAAAVLAKKRPSSRRSTEPKEMSA